MNRIILAGCLTLGVVSACAFYLFQVQRDSSSETETLVVAEIPTRSQLAQKKKKFRTMAVSERKPCTLPIPPYRVYEEPGQLREVTRFLAMEEWQKTGSCDCLVNDLDWDDVNAYRPDLLQRLKKIGHTDLKAYNLKIIADEMEIERYEACGF